MDETTAIIIAVGVVVISIGLFIFTYLLNKRTPKPEGCKNFESECEGCQMTSCSHHSANKKEKDEEGETK